MARRMTPGEALKAGQFRYGLGPVSVQEKATKEMGRRIRPIQLQPILKLTFRATASPKEICRLLVGGHNVGYFYIDEENLARVKAWGRQDFTYWGNLSVNQRGVSVRGLNTKSDWYNERIKPLLEEN
ncbi:MAG: hypothetical protein A2571_02520 [Candidatus Vogelbacteria bacterium RIFOXYD1_FULL_44_32]|uniref:Uncharacterized protein n=1 Tax=Candidatus Vogelbacteria bacterium RIFOXYD1_FULL_44_32 TaxID=1802438 RepID=A0A1G2QEW5_9BACT|nr:MAG: hypothetical protein A2571_02520 [Candidatus Vogelbacteria bacterium RIFOXYD1_FULL_44_32]